MSVRPVDFNGMMQSQQNVSNVKQNEDQRPILQQQQAFQTVVKQEEASARQVVNKNDLSREEYKFDARDGSKNEYQNNQRKKKEKQKEKMEDGHVRIKGMSGGFDMTI
ncbi:MAG: hypothetical protein SOT58_08635 [Agathobacter sp.]|nr:hypothetical protein [Agathobacter sp.]